jgi:hypothetical protein
MSAQLRCLKGMAKSPSGSVDRWAYMVIFRILSKASNSFLISLRTIRL